MKSAWKEETGFFFTNFCQWFRIFENDLLCQKKMHNAKDGMVRAAKMCLEVSTNICDGIFWKSVSSHSFKRIARTSPKLTHHHFYLKLIWCQSLMTIWKPESPNSEFDLGASGGLYAHKANRKVFKIFWKKFRLKMRVSSEYSSLILA